MPRFLLPQGYACPRGCLPPGERRTDLCAPCIAQIAADLEFDEAEFWIEPDFSAPHDPEWEDWEWGDDEDDDLPF